MKITMRAFVALTCAALAVGLSPHRAWAGQQEPTLTESYPEMGRFTEPNTDSGVDDYAGRVQNPYSVNDLNMTSEAPATLAPKPAKPAVAKPTPAARPYEAPRPSAAAPVAQPGCVAACESCAAPCGNWCDPCCGRPTWSVRFDTLSMNRSHADYRTLAREIGSGDVLLGTNDLDFNWEPAFRFGLQRRLGASDWDLEVSYMQMDSFDAEGTVTSADLFSFTAPNLTVLAGDGLDTGMAFKYTSRLYSTEVNLKKCLGPMVTILGGFRWIEMSEELSGRLFDNAGSVPFWSTDVNNHLCGGQIGADVTLWNRGGPLSIRSIGKAGIYTNYVDQASTSPAFQNVRASDTHTAFVGELELVGVYQLREHLSLRAGYEMLWLSGVALAPEQINLTNLPNGVAAVDPGSDAFYHGFVGGVELTW